MARKVFNIKAASVLLICAAVLAVTVFALRQWQRKRTAIAAYHKGLQAYRSRLWKDAAKNLGHYAARNRGDVQTLLKYAQAQLNIRPLKSGNVQQAAATYRAISRIDKTNPEAAEKLIGLYLQMDIPAEAQLIAERYLQYGNDDKINTMLAISLAKQRKFEQAAAILQAVVKEHPDQILAYEVLGHLVQSRGEDFPDKGLYWLNKAVENNPLAAQAFIARADFYMRVHDLPKALTDLEKAEKLPLANLDTRLRLAGKFAQANAFDKAQIHFSQIEAQDPTNTNLWQLWAMVAMKTMSEQEMLNLAQRGLKNLEPDTYDFMPFAAELFIRCRRLDLAGDCIDRLKQAGVEPPTAAFLEGLLAEAQRKDYKAIMLWRSAQQLGDKSEKLRRMLAKAYSRTGNDQSAVLQLRKLVSEQPDSHKAHLELAKLLAQTGQWAEAAEQARLAQQIAPDGIEPAIVNIQAKMQLAQVAAPPHDKQIRQDINRAMEKLQDLAGNIPAVKLLRFQMAVQQEEFAAAEKLLKEMKTGQQARLEVEIAEVDLLMAQKNTRPAIEKLYGLTREFPQNTVAIKYLAVLLNQQDDRKDCQRVFKEGIENVKNDADKRDLGILLAALYGQWGQSDKAHKLLTELSEQLPDDIGLKRQLLKEQWVKKDPLRAQQLVNEIKAIETQQGWQWRYEQAKLWFLGEDFEKRYPQIIVLLKENLTADPSDQAGMMLLAATYQKQGDEQLAIATYRQALNRWPDNISIIVQTVAALYKTKEYEQADKILNQALRVNVAHPDLSILKLQNAVRQGKWDSAETMLEDLALKDPNNYDFGLSLALLKTRRNKFEQARELLNSLKTQHPGSLAVTAALVELSIRENRIQDALAICDQAVKQFNSAASYILRGKTYALLDRNSEAKKDLDQATAIDPEHTESWICKGDFNLAAGQIQEAVENIAKGLATSPGNLQVQKRMIAVLLSSGGPEKIYEGQQLLEKALSSNPTDTDLKLYKVHCLLVKATAPAIAQAENILLNITQQQPKIAKAWAYLIEIYLQQQQSGKVMEAVLGGLTYSAGNKELLLLKARAEASHSAPLAIATLKAVNEQQPHDTEVAAKLAELYTQTGQGEKAILLLENLLTHCREKDRRFVNTALAINLYKNGYQYLAKQNFDMLYSLRGDDSKVLLAEMQLLADDHHWQELNRKVTDWLVRNPHDTDTVITIAGKLIDTNNDHARNIAENILSTVLDRNPDGIEAMNPLAVLLQTTGRVQEAEKLYRRILEIKADSAVAVNNLAWILCEHQHKYSQALELAQRGLKMNPEYIDLIDTRGVIYYRLGQHHKAGEDFARCVRLYPKNRRELAVAHLHLALVLADLKEDSSSIENLKKTLELNNKLGGLSPKQVSQARHLLGKLSPER
ncbi:MAG TPA: tetratricopeptide repeat protein [Sedimentisphaerales bacterium]|nr:tetratricopeptide repeat protein [Sedimentisphaerales bacterium]